MDREFIGLFIAFALMVAFIFGIVALITYIATGSLECLVYHCVSTGGEEISVEVR